MAEEKTYVCPNCGAKTTNTENCEHCGSLLVRFVVKGIDISGSSYFDNSLVFPGLVNELKNNLRLQVEKRQEVRTDILWTSKTGTEENDEDIIVYNLCDSSEIESQNSPIQIGIELNFSQITNPESPGYDINFYNKTENEFAKFIQLLSFPLFVSDIEKNGDDLDRYYEISCGQDAEGAARLLSEILIKVMGLSPSDNYRIITSYEDEEYVEVSKYESNSQNISNNDSIGNQNNQAKVLDNANELKKEKEVEVIIDSDKFIASFKDLVIQALTNCNEIKSKAEKGDAESCSQMGMIHLLGINTPIDFKKASQYFGKQSLADDVDANRMLGFIAECEGNYSLAFKKYANAATGSKAKKSYINKVFSERNDFYGYLKKLGFSGSLLNKEITTVLNDYIKGGDTKLDASIKLAVICEDEESCLDAAQSLFDAGDYQSAMRWLQIGNVSNGHALYASIENKISGSKSAHNLPNTLDVVEIDGNSILANLGTTPSYARIKELCDETAVACKREWKNAVSPNISAIKKKLDDEEATRVKKQKEEEAARLKKQRDEEQRILLQEQEAKRKKKKKQRKMIFLVYIPIVLCILGMLIPSSNTSGSEKTGVSNAIATGIVLAGGYYMIILSFYFYYFIFKVIYKVIKKLF